MRRKNIEKIIFHTLMALPLIIFAGLFLVQIIRNWHGVNDINVQTIEMLFYDTASLFLMVESNGALGSLMEAFMYLFGIFGIAESSMFPYLLLVAQIMYMIVIELVWLLYDFIIFLPRMCRSLIERGMNSK